MAIRLPVYESHVQLDSGAHTIARIHADDSTGRALAKIGESIQGVARHWQKKQEQFEAYRYASQLTILNTQLAQIATDVSNEYKPGEHPPGWMHQEIVRRSGGLIRNWVNNAPDSQKERAVAHGTSLGVQVDHGAANAESQVDKKFYSSQLKTLVGQFAHSLATNPAGFNDAVKSYDEMLSKTSSLSASEKMTVRRADMTTLFTSARDALIKAGKTDEARALTDEFTTKMNSEDKTQRGAGSAAGAHGGLNKEAFDKTFKGTPLEGKYDKVVEVAQKNGVPPELMAGIMAHETDRGRSKMLAERNNPAGLMDPANQSKTGMKFATVEDGIEQAGQSIAKNYQAGGQSISGMAKTYAPVGAENDPRRLNAGWTAGVTRYTQQFGGGGTAGTGPTTDGERTFASGTIHEPIARATSIGGKVGDDSASRGKGQHQGNDIMAPVGTPVIAVKDGTVERISTDHFNTPVVVIKHSDGTYSRYMHLSGVDVQKGDTVKGGDQIGKSGTANGVPHLHYEAWTQAPNKSNTGLLEPSRVFAWSKTNLPSGRAVESGQPIAGGPKGLFSEKETGTRTIAGTAEEEPALPKREAVGVVDEQGNKIVVDPKTGKMIRQQDLAPPGPGAAAPMGQRFAAAATGAVTDAATQYPNVIEPSQIPAAGPSERTGYIQTASGEQATIPLPQPRPDPNAISPPAVPAAAPTSYWDAIRIDSHTAISGGENKLAAQAQSFGIKLKDSMAKDILTKQEEGRGLVLSDDLKRFYGLPGNALTYELIAGKLGEGAAITWQENSQSALKYHSITADFDQLPKSVIDARLEANKPNPALPTYPQDREVYIDAWNHRNKILDGRDPDKGDPAAAAMRLPDVQNAAKRYNDNPTPENAKALMDATMEGQKYLGILVQDRSPITKETARILAGPLMDREATAKTSETVINEIKKMTGGDPRYARRIYETVLMEAGRKADEARIKANALTLPPDPTPATSKEEVLKNNVFSPSMAAAQEARRSGYYGAPGIEPYVVELPPVPTAGEGQYVPTVLVPADMVQDLAGNPSRERKADFDRAFGIGASDYHLAAAAESGATISPLKETFPEKFVGPPAEDLKEAEAISVYDPNKEDENLEGPF